MMCRSVVESFRLSLISLVSGCFFVSSAWAEGFQCQHQTGGVEPTLVCTDDSGVGYDTAAMVSLRKMPRWGAHAGLTVIDLCLVPKSRLDPSMYHSPKIDDPAQLKLPLQLLTKNCERRYCTDERHDFSLLINSVPIPIGWTAVSFWLGYQQSSFSIRCDSLVVNPGLQ